MVICFRRDFEQLAQAQLALSRTELHALLAPTTSYVSMVELGMYDMTGKLHQQLGAKHKPGSDEFESAFDVEMETQRQRVTNRLFLELPKARHVCFYPMNKKRDASDNWYSEPFERRAAMMREHGMIGRTYAGKVTQVISGSIGYDDWEWGVDLFAQDPIVFKKLIYEMRFDEASARIRGIRSVLYRPPVRASSAGLIPRWSRAPAGVNRYKIRLFCDPDASICNTPHAQSSVGISGKSRRMNH